MFAFGIQPPEDLWKEKPDDLSVSSAASSWQVGFQDGATSTTHAIFENEGVQMFYDDGYERGERERKVADEINARHGEDPARGEEVEVEVVVAEPTRWWSKALAFHSEHKVLIRDVAAAIQAASLAVVAVGMWTRKERG